MRIKLYLDEDVDISLAHALKQKGIDVLTTQESGNKRLSDSEQLEFAVNNKRVMFTHNKRDFLLLHKSYLLEGRSHYGIILSDPAIHLFYNSLLPQYAFSIISTI